MLKYRVILVCGKNDFFLNLCLFGILVNFGLHVTLTEFLAICLHTDHLLIFSHENMTAETQNQNYTFVIDFRRMNRPDILNPSVLLSISEFHFL